MLVRTAVQPLADNGLARPTVSQVERIADDRYCIIPECLHCNTNIFTEEARLKEFDKGVTTGISETALTPP